MTGTKAHYFWPDYNPRKLHEREWLAGHPIPELSVPDGWEWNPGMNQFDGRQKSLIRNDSQYHIDIMAVVPTARLDGNYFCRLLVSDENFATFELEEIDGLEPGEVQEAVYLLVGKAWQYDSDVYGGSDG